MSNISSLFENLMAYNDAEQQRSKKVVKEADQTLLNLTVELPADTEDITPEDVNVEVGVMTIDDEGATEPEENEENVDDSSENEEDEIDVTPEDEEIENEPKETEGAEESLKLENKTNCTGDDNCECESCKTKSLDKNSLEETTDVETAKANIRKRVANVEECNEPKVKKEAHMHLDTKSINKLVTEFVRENYKNVDKITFTKAVLENNKLILKGYISDLEGKKESITLVNRGFNAKKLENTRFLIDFKDMSQTFGIVKESLKQPFVFTANMTNGIVKFESLKYDFKTQLTEGKVARVSGECILNEGLFDKSAKQFVTSEFQTLKQFLSLDTESEAHMTDDGLGFSVETNKGDKLKAELKRAGYKETSQGDYYKKHDKDTIMATFEPKGSLNSDNPEYLVTFSARKKDTKQIKESSLNENANQIAKFNEIVDKIKAAKTPNDLSDCKDLIDDSNIGDTLLSAAQMLWDDVNSRMVASTNK